MNTVEKGDLFEDVSYNLIIDAIRNEDLAIPLKYARVF